MKFIPKHIAEKFGQHTYILSSSFIVVTVSLLANVFAYIFQLIVGRYFSIEEYGQVTSLFALSGIIPLILIIFTGATPKMAAEIKDKNYPYQISRLFFTLLKFHTIVAFIIFASMLISQKKIGEYLQINDPALINLFSLAVAMGMLIAFMAPFMQGLMRFKAFSAITFITAFAKLLVGLCVVYFGLQVKDVFSGLAISTITVGIFSILLLKKNLKFSEFKNSDSSDFRKLMEYSLYSSLAILGLFLIQNIDIIEVKHLFEPTLAGIYGSTGVIGKIIFYAASPVAIVMMPICSEKFKKGENFVKPFFISIGLVGLIAVSGTLIYYLFPETAIQILFGEKYLAVKDYLPLYSIYMLFYTMLYVISLFLISISEFKASSIAIAAAIAQYIGIQFFAKNLYDVIWISNYSVIAATLILALYIFRLFNIKNAN
jgi:O-antigen/teichoic acid export membrane protein